MQIKVANTFNFNSNLFNLRDKLIRDLSLQNHIYNIQHRPMQPHHRFKYTSYPTSLTSTISSLPHHQTTTINSLYKPKKVLSLRDNFLSSRMNFNRLKTEELNLSNTHFKIRLERISSPLSRKKMNESYFKLRQYEKISKKVKMNQENKKRETNVLRKLPKLYIRGNKCTSY